MMSFSLYVSFFMFLKMSNIIIRHGAHTSNILTIKKRFCVSHVELRLNCGVDMPIAKSAFTV